MLNVERHCPDCITE